MPLRAAGLHHAALTVRDLERSLAWYVDLLDLDVVLDERGDDRRAVVLRLPGTEQLLGLVEHVPGAGTGFDARRTGLDHLAFAVAGRSELDAWAARLDELGAPHSGVLESPRGAILNFKDPDGIALAAFWDAPPARG